MSDYFDTSSSYYNDVLNQAHFNPSSTKKGVNYGNTVFTDKQKNDLDAQDFLNLMITQLKNQDFMNPSSDTEFLSQLAQFTSMQYMSDLAGYAKQNYVSSLVGQTITASKFTVSGELDTVTGVVDRISLVDDEYVVYVGKKSYTLDQIMEIGATSGSSGTKPTPPTDSSDEDEEEKTDYTQSSFLMSLLGQNVTVRDKSGKETTGLVQKVSMTDGMRFQVGNVWYGMEDFVTVNAAEKDNSEELDEDEELVIPPEEA